MGLTGGIKEGKGGMEEEEEKLMRGRESRKVGGGAGREGGRWVGEQW